MLIFHAAIYDVRVIFGVKTAYRVFTRSGVGKSTLVNALAGREIMKTKVLYCMDAIKMLRLC